MAKKNQDTQTDQPEAKAEGLYSLTFGDAPTTPAELWVGLPGGAKVYMNKFYKGDPGGDGWPYAELTVEAKDVARLTRDYSAHGLLLKKIEASAMAQNPLATPQAPE